MFGYHHPIYYWGILGNSWIPNSNPTKWLINVKKGDKNQASMIVVFIPIAGAAGEQILENPKNGIL